MEDLAATEEFISAVANPSEATAAAEAVLTSVTSAPTPVISFPGDDMVELPGGIEVDGVVYRTAKVQELTGEHEELLARASQNNNPFHFINTLLECGTVSIGDAPPHQTKDLLKKLLIGDRDALILGIRRATYGDDVEIEQFICPFCEDAVDLNVTLDDIETITLDTPEDKRFEVELRKGRTALVQLPTGHDQFAVFAQANTTSAQKDTILLGRCVVSITGPDGQVTNVAAEPKVVLRMAIPDRKKILREIVERQPGPRYNEIKFKHEVCGSEVPLPLTVADLFRDM